MYTHLHLLSLAACNLVPIGTHCWGLLHSPACEWTAPSFDCAIAVARRTCIVLDVATTLHTLSELVTSDALPYARHWV